MLCGSSWQATRPTRFFLPFFVAFFLTPSALLRPSVEIKPLAVPASLSWWGALSCALTALTPYGGSPERPAGTAPAFRLHIVRFYRAWHHSVFYFHLVLLSAAVPSTAALRALLLLVMVGRRSGWEETRPTASSVGNRHRRSTKSCGGRHGNWTSTLAASAPPVGLPLRPKPKAGQDRRKAESQQILEVCWRCTRSFFFLDFSYEYTRVLPRFLARRRCTSIALVVPHALRRLRICRRSQNPERRQPAQQPAALVPVVASPPAAEPDRPDT